MSSPESGKYRIETQVVVGDEDLNLARAASAAKLMLDIWRARFTDGTEGGQVSGEYEDPEYGKTKIESPDPSKVNVVNQGPDGLETTYDFDAAAGRLTVDVTAPDERTVTPPHAPVFALDALSRLLFEADEHEALGR